MSKISWFSGIILIFMLPLTVYAGNNSLTVNFKGYSSGFSIYRIADNELNNTEDFNELELNYSEIKTARDMSEAAEAAVSYVEERDIPPLASLRGKDSLTFEGLDDGVYLVRFNNYNKGVEMSSFLINLPYYDKVANNYLTAPSVNSKTYVDYDDEDNEDIPDADKEEDPEIIFIAPGGGATSDKAEIRLEPQRPVSRETTVKTEPVTEIVTEPVTTRREEVYTETTLQENTEVETVIETEEESESKWIPFGNLPQTGGDQTVIFCFYTGGVLVFIGVIILLINNKKRVK